MHDPMSVLFEIKYPWFTHRPWPKPARDAVRRVGEKLAWEGMSAAQQRSHDRMWPKGYRSAFITVWHRDPEKNGDDDSCGKVPLTETQANRLDSLAWSEARNPYFMRIASKEWSGSRIEAEAMMRALHLHVARILGVRMTFDEAARRACLLVHRPDCVDPCGSFVHLPGYHTNSSKDSREDRQERFYSTLYWISQTILLDRRRWWRRRPFHFHHWRLQIHPLQAIHRRLFDRCEVCGEGFGADEPIVSTCWDRPEKSLWQRVTFWKSDRYLRHERCLEKQAKPA